ncbi:Hypothetical protein R9X50_00009900 [Acrodontium crateriforme]|uniref:Autophagy-related protein n=1 Tax=Acrodontium crateriforme TaxID=150365 RepID=A0AAQ3M014_9PEZI|nr:Hypothetical protein R9X50_00009900 [Acrodontium crateriforme]
MASRPSLRVPTRSSKHFTTSANSSWTDEADDERSPLSPHSVMVSMSGSEELPPPAYPGEDTRPTSKKELLGFYTYSFAAEVFVVCGLGAFIPIVLEDLARLSATAVLASDHTKSCRVPELSAPGNYTMVNPPPGSQQCVFKFFGAEINTASFAMYTFSASVLIQSLVVITMSGAADHGRYRKTLLLTFAVVGSIATMLFLIVTPAVYLLGSLWAIIGNVCFGASFVLLNSFLPLLVRNHPSTRTHEASQQASYSGDSEIIPPRASSFDEPSMDDALDSTAALLPSSEQAMAYPDSKSTSSEAMQLSTKISANGIGIGYIAAVIVQILSVFTLSAMNATLFSLRLVLFFIGLWWFIFTIPSARWLRPRPGPPLAKSRSWTAYVTYSWVKLGKTIIRARRLKDVLLFLAAWFMISDAIATVSGTAILFAKTSLGMKSSSLAMINVVVTLSGIAGAFTWSKVSRMMQLTPIQTIITCICLFELIPLYGLLGYLPAVQRLGWFGLQQQWEMYPVGAVYGLVLGGLSSYCRSLFGELVPKGSEAAFYALYAVTDKGSSVFGPAIVGAITDATGDIRPAFWFLAALIGLPIPIMCLVDVQRGKQEGAALAKEATIAPPVSDNHEHWQDEEGED